MDPRALQLALAQIQQQRQAAMQGMGGQTLQPQGLLGPQGPLQGAMPAQPGGPQAGPQMAPPGGAAPQQPQRKPGFFDNLLGIPGGASEEQRAMMKRQGLLGLGSALLQASGKGMRLSEGIGAALPAGQQAAMGALQQQHALQQQDRQLKQQQQRDAIMEKYANMPRTVENMRQMSMDLMRIGDYESLGPVAAMMNAVQQTMPGSGQRLHFQMNEDTGTMHAFDPFTGEEKQRTYLMENGRAATLTGNQLQHVDRVRDDFIKEAGETLGQNAAAYRIGQAVRDIRRAVEQGDEQLAHASALTLLFAYGKLNDPGSVVRESEMKAIMGQGNIEQRLENFIAKFREGTVGMGTLNSIARTAGAQVEGAREQFEAYKRAAEGRLRDGGVGVEFLRAPDVWEFLEGLIPEYGAEYARVNRPKPDVLTQFENPRRYP